MKITTAIALSLGLPTLFANSQSGTAPAKPQATGSYTGCLTPVSTAPDNFVLANANRCYLVADPAAAKGVGHEVVLKASLVPQQGNQPITLVLKGPVEVKAACSQTCTLHPPGTRGLGPGDKPGPEGATQGVTSSPQPQP